MKKLLLLLGLVLGLSSISHAYVQLTYQVAVGTFTTTTILVSTSAAVDVDSPTVQNRVSMEVQNIDSSANLWCGGNNSVAKNNARKIAPGNSWIMAIGTDGNCLGQAGATCTLSMFCISDGASSSSATITQAW